MPTPRGGGLFRRQLRPAAHVARLDLLRWRRQRSALVATLVFPTLVAALMVAALGGDPTVDTTWAVVDEDGGPATGAFVEAVETHPELREAVTLRMVDRRDGEELLRRHRVSALVVLPDGLSESVLAGTPDRITVHARPADEPGTDVARLVADQFRVRAWATGQEIALQSGEPGGTWPLEVALASTTGRELDPATHYGPAVGVFMLLMVFSFATENQALDRTGGLNDRLTSAGVPATSVVLGRAIAAGLLGLLTLGLTAAIMSEAFDRSWGPAGPVAALIAAVVVCYVGIAALITSRVGTGTRPQVVTVTIGLLLALGSGSLAPPNADLPAIAPFLPTTYAMRGFAEVAVSGAGLRDVTAEVALLVAFGAGALAAAMRLTRLTA